MYFKKTGLASNPDVIRIFNRIGKTLQSDSTAEFVNEGTGMNKSPAEAQREANMMLGDAKGPLMNARHPAHADAVKEYNRLMSIAKLRPGA